MKLYAWALLASLLPLEHAVAAQEDAVAPGQKIAATQAVPWTVRKLLPQRGKSFLWGTLRLKPGEPSLGLHLFKAERRQGQDEGRSDQKFTLDVFRLAGTSWRRVNRVAVRYPSDIWAPQRVDAQALWLDVQRRIPIVKFTLFVDGYRGPIGDEVAVVFARGLAKPPAVQSWRSGFTSSTGRSNDWSTRDEGGYLRVLSAETDVEVPDEQGEAIAQQVTPWTWQGQRFEPGKTMPRRYKDLETWPGKRHFASPGRTR